MRRLCTNQATKSFNKKDALMKLNFDNLPVVGETKLNKPGRANRCVRSGSVCNCNVLRLFSQNGNGRMDGHTNGRMDRPSYGDAWTHLKKKK